MLDFDLDFVGTVTDEELRRLLRPENRDELKQRMDDFKNRKDGDDETNRIIGKYYGRVFD